MTKINELQNGMKRIELEAKVTDVAQPRTVQSRFNGESYKVAVATIQDETGTTKLTLWNEQIDQVSAGQKVKVSNGYVTSFKGEIQLNVGKFGTLTVVA